MRIMPEERSRPDLSALEQRHQADAIAMLFRKRRQTGEFEQSRIEIRGNDRCVTHAPGLCDTRRDYDPRLANPAFVGPAFSTAERQIASRPALGSGEAAIVRHENHDGPLGQPGAVERCQHAANSCVELLEHRGIGGMVLNEADLVSTLVAPGIRWRRAWTDRKSTRLNSSQIPLSRMPSC